MAKRLDGYSIGDTSRESQGYSAGREADSYGHDAGRRGFLRKAALVLGGSLVAKAGYNIWKYGDQIEDTVRAVRRRVAMPRNVECLHKGSLIPEDERTGKEILTGVIPDFSPLPIVGGYEFEEEFDTNLRPFLSQLSDNTHVGVLIPTDSKEQCLELLNARHPNLRFAVYQLPFTESGLMFPQDIVFATGAADRDGKAVIAASSIEAKQFNALSRAQEFKRSRRELFEPLITRRRIRGLIVDNDKSEEAAGGIHDFGDEFLAERYPEKFDLKYVPVATAGGDLQVSRLPDGRLGLIVGKENLSRTVFAMQLEQLNGKGVDERAFNSFDSMDPKMFEVFLERAKELYKRYFGVDEVIVIDEPYIRSVIKANNPVKHSGLAGYKFFHNDMIVKTATAGSGRRVAFCSKQRPNGVNGDYLYRVQGQFADLGYDVELLECGIYPALNYTNSVMFRGLGGRTVVMLPQYGIPQDSKAAEAYGRHGFEVKKVDMSALKQLPPEDQMSTGSLHCKFVVLS